MDHIITYSGWICTIISTIIAIIQFKQKESYKKKVTNLTNNIENFNATNKGVAIKTNSGPIDIR